VATGGSPLVVLFLRGLDGGLARAAIAAAHAALPRLDAAGVRLVAFTRSDLDFARDFVPRHHVLFPVVVDSDGAWFATYGVARDRGLLRSVTGLRPAKVRAAFGTLGRGTGLPRGGADQLPAEFVVDADGRLRYARYGRTVLDLPDFEALCAAAS
jgi:peroxiredoxin